MGSREELHGILVGVLGSDHVYYQPPETIKIVYPCIIYGLDSTDTKFADNTKYNRMRRYTVTLIDRRPESPVVDDIESLKYCSFGRHFTSDNLHHYSFTLYY